MASQLRIALYNPLSLVGVGRTQEIFDELKADIVLLPGTQVREWPGRRYHVQRGTGHMAISFVWQRAPLSNKAAGCTILLGRRIRPQHLRLRHRLPSQGGAVCSGSRAAILI